MEQLPSNLQVLLQAAEYVERREREAEHGYASILPCDTATPGRRKRQRTNSNPDSVRIKTPPDNGLAQYRSPHSRQISPAKGLIEVYIHNGHDECLHYTPNRSQHQSTALQRKSPSHNAGSVHNELEKHRRAQLRRCLEQLKQQVPLSVDTSRHTTLSLLHRAKQHIKKLEDQELRAKNLKEKLRTEQQKLRQRLKQLLPSNSTERIRADSLDSSTLSSERSDSDQEDLEIDVEGVILSGNEGDLFVSFSAGMEHSYSTPAHAWL